MAALLGACVPSVNPFYTSEDTLFDARLVGDWQTKGDAKDLQTWSFVKGDENAYTVNVLSEKDQKKGKFVGHLFKIQDRLFLDLIPTDCSFAPDQNDLINAAMFPGHLLLSVPQVEPTLKLALCDYDWLTKFLKEHPNAFAHHRDGDRLLLTGKTKDLQAFVSEHLNDLFESPSEFTRKKTE
jgi:hypothetical protein